MVTHQVDIFTFLSKGEIPHFGDLYLAECIFTSFWRMIPRRVYRDSPKCLVNFICLMVRTFFFPIVCSYYFQRCPINSACLLFIEKVLDLILTNDNPQRVSIVILANGTPQSVPRLTPTFTLFLCPMQSSFFCPIVCNYYFQRCPMKNDC